MSEHPRLVRIAQLQRKLSQREGEPGYEKNCEEIRKEIQKLEKAQDAEEAPGDYDL